MASSNIFRLCKTAEVATPGGKYKWPAGIDRFALIGMAALIAWMLVVRVGILVKDGAISAVTRVFDALWRRRLRRSAILDKNTNTN
jgi:hypothetical protein